MAVFLIAPNAFKGSITSVEAAMAIAQGISTNHQSILFPIADGGDGSLLVINKLLKAELRKYSVVDPLGSAVLASLGWEEKNKRAIIELAEASGLRLLLRNQRDPMRATTFGTGMLIKEAVSLGASEILLTLGGSATVDGGLGILSALGVRFYNGEVELKNPSPMDMEDITRYQADKAISILRNTNIKILSDVENPLLGDSGASTVFAPQKGASRAEVLKLEKGLESFSKVIQQQEGTRIGAIKFGGAAGGVAAVLHGIFRAELLAGASYILRLGDFESLLSQCDGVITGEGKLDAQTLLGKGPAVVAKLAKKYGKHVIVVCGFSELGASYPGYFDQIIEIADSNLDLEANMRQTAEHLVMSMKSI